MKVLGAVNNMKCAERLTLNWQERQWLFLQIPLLQLQRENREMLKASGSEGKSVEKVILLCLDALNPNALPHNSCYLI